MATSTLILLLTFWLFSATPADVYICRVSDPKKYHMIKNCTGLRNCSTEIEKVSIKEATEGLKRTRCAIRTCQKKRPPLQATFLLLSLTTH